MRRLLLGGIIALALSVAAHAQGGILSGTWEMSADIDLEEATFADAINISTEMTATYTVDSSSLSATLNLDSANPYQPPFAVFEGESTLGAFMLRGATYFGLKAGTFAYAWASLELNMSGVMLGARPLLVHNPNDETPQDLLLELTIVGQAVNGMTFDFTSTFGTYVPDYPGMPSNFTLDRIPAYWPLVNGGDTDGLCDLPFQRADISVRSLAFCCAFIDVELSFSCTGFEAIELSARGIQVEPLPWLQLDASLVFSMQTKSLVLTPRVDAGVAECELRFIFRPATDQAELPAGSPFAITPLTLTGLYLRCQLSDVGFAGFARANYLTLTFAITPEGTSECCFPPSLALIAAYGPASDLLFDLQFVAIMVKWPLRPNLRMEIAAHHQPTAHSTRMQVGFEYVW